jgi:hypothetical protein
MKAKYTTTLNVFENQKFLSSGGFHVVFLNLCLELWRFAFVWYNMQCRRCKRVKAMVFNATFKNISLLLLEETGAPGENQ